MVNNQLSDDQIQEHLVPSDISSSTTSSSNSVNDPVSDSPITHLVNNLSGPQLLLPPSDDPEYIFGMEGEVSRLALSILLSINQCILMLIIIISLGNYRLVYDIDDMFK